MLSENLLLYCKFIIRRYSSLVFIYLQHRTGTYLYTDALLPLIVMSPPPPKYQAVLPPDSIPASPYTRPAPNPIQPEVSELPHNTLRPVAAASTPSKKKRNNHRGGKKRRNRRQSFAGPSDNGSSMGEISQLNRAESRGVRDSFYIQHGRNLSNTSLESEALLDHR